MNSSSTRQLKPVDEHLRDHYAQAALTADALAQLRTVIATTDATIAPSRHSGWWLMTRAAAALLLVALGIGITLLVTETERGDPVDRIVAYVASQHRTLKVNEFNAGSYDELGQQMDRLDFEPIEPARLHGRAADDELILLGGRYCAIEDHIAARVHLIDSSGRRWTLFQCRAADILAGLGPHSRTIDGNLVVDLWEEDGVFFAMAHSGDPLRP